jgi:TolA-binding protein
VAAEAWFRSAECYEKLGDAKSAQAAWQRVVDSYAGTDWAKRAADKLNAKPSASGKP